ncbi:MAG: PEP/pyruvate-binding domain-containing protein, partial [Anaerolineae bacterium]
MSRRPLEELVESYDAQAAKLQTVQAGRVRDILLVASLYDSFTLSEGKHLTELIFGEYYSLSLSSSPRITRVSTRGKALQLLAERDFDLVITMSQVADMSATEFGQSAKDLQPDLPVFLLAYTMHELAALEGGAVTIPGIDRAFLWRGDVRLFLTIIKLVEDMINVDHDTEEAGVRTLILVEDNVAFYSSYLPLLLSELVKQTQSLITEEVNLGQRMLRRRLRPKIMLATTYEEAWELYERYKDTVLAVMSDVRFPRGGEVDSEAGLRLLQRVRDRDARLPLLLQSSERRFDEEAAELHAGFIDKQSPTLLHDVRAFMLDSLGFGDFVFRLPDGTEVARAKDVQGMVDVIETVPDEALRYHGHRHDFSNWLMARTEFATAETLRRLQVSDFESIEEMRAFLVETLGSVQAERRRGQVEDFDAESFGPDTAFVRIGSGSLGGKGRGLAFMHELLSRGNVGEDLEDVEVFVPHSAVIGTDVFDRFMDVGDLREFALREQDDRAILERFMSEDLPPDTVADLRAYLDVVREPIAVRSSSLLEDSQLLPAAGIYPTHMLPNSDDDLDERLDQLLQAVKHLYASTFFEAAKAYLATTANLVEDEKMAVVLQKVVGRRHGDVVYPGLSGTAASYNFYPVREMEPDEGVANVALGLGKTVVEGERSVRFSPEHEQWLPQFSTPAAVLESSQRGLWALDLTRRLDFLEPEPDQNLVYLELDEARRHGTLWPVASIYSPDNDAVYDGLSRPGVPVVTFAPILKHGLLPLPQVLRSLLDLGQLGMSVPVEIEFAAVLQPEDNGPRRFALLQIRPLGSRSAVHRSVDLGAVSPDDVFIKSENVLGAGRIEGIRDIVAVRPDTFD